MKKILTIEEAIKIAQELNNQKKRIVLVGGCFDILHVGHIAFLDSAKKYGDLLMILLENDEAVKKLKGNKRPINTQKDRAVILGALSAVDYVTCLERVMTNEDYDQLVLKIKPAIIATTKNDPERVHKKRQADMLNISVIDVIGEVARQSTSRVAKLLEEQFSL